MPADSAFAPLDALLSDCLGRAGLVPSETLSACSALAQARGVPLGEALLSGGHLEPSLLEEAYARLPQSGRGPLHLGELIAGRYRVEGLLGQGGMGAVYRVQELESQRALALKVILPGSAEELDLLRFQREGEVAARLSQAQGFVRVHSGGEHRRLPYFVMDLVDGKDLESALAAGLSPEDLARVLARVGRGLQACHEAGLVHRDLKPANILLDSQGPKVADLGLVRDRDAKTLTQTGEILGTPAYMAPEQVLDARSVDARTDVYALGAILYRGLAGRPPFSGGLIKVLDQIVTRDPPRPSTLVPATPRALEQVCLHAIAKDPADRYASTEDFARDLENALEGQPLQGFHPRRSPRARIAAGLILGLGLLAFGVWRGVVSSKPPASPTSSRRSLDPKSAARTRLRTEFAKLLDPEARRPLPTIRERARSAPDRAALAGLSGEEIKAVKLEQWRAVQGAWRERLRRLALDSRGDPSADFAALRVALTTPPGVVEGVADVTSAAFARLIGEGDSRRAVALQLQRRLLELDPPLALKVLVQKRYRLEPREAVLDCLRVDVPLTVSLATSRNRIRLDLRDSSAIQGLPPGQLRGYLEWLLEFSRRTLPTQALPGNRDYLAKIVVAIGKVLQMAPDLGRRACVELKWQQLKAIAIGAELALKDPSETKESKAEIRLGLRRVYSECLAQMEVAEGSLVDELAEVASMASFELGLPDQGQAGWERAATILERQRADPPFMESPTHSLGKVVRILASHHQRKGEHEAALEAIRYFVSLLPAICERLKELGLPPTKEFQERYLGEGAEIAIDSCLALERYEEGEEFLEGCFSSSRVQLQPGLGDRAVELAVKRGDLKTAEARIKLLEEAGLPLTQTQGLRDGLPSQPR